MKKSRTTRISRRKLLGASFGSSAAVVAGTASASAREEGNEAFKTTGAESMTLEEFRSLNGEGAVAKLIGSMDCDLLAMCHRRMQEEHGVWIPELVPMFSQIDARMHPSEA